MSPEPGYLSEAFHQAPTGPGIVTQWDPFPATEDNWKIMTQPESANPAAADDLVIGGAGSLKDLYAIDWPRPSSEVVNLGVVIYAVNRFQNFRPLTPVIRVNGEEIDGATFIPVYFRDALGFVIDSVPAVSTVFPGPFRPESRDWLQAGFKKDGAQQIQVFSMRVKAENRTGPRMAYYRRGPV